MLSRGTITAFTRTVYRWRNLGYRDPGPDLTVRVNSDAVSGRGFLFALELEAWGVRVKAAEVE